MTEDRIAELRARCGFAEEINNRALITMIEDNFGEGVALYVLEAMSSMPLLISEIYNLRSELEQERTRLAGCLVAAEGGAVGDNDCEKGAYGWSPPFAKIKELWAEILDRRHADTELAGLNSCVSLESKSGLLERHREIARELQRKYIKVL